MRTGDCVLLNLDHHLILVVILGSSPVLIILVEKHP